MAFSIIFTRQNRLHIGLQVIRAFEPLLEMIGVFLWILFCQRLKDLPLLGIKTEKDLPCIVRVLRTFCFKISIERSDSIRSAHPSLTVRRNTYKFLNLLDRLSTNQRNEIGINQLECRVDVPGVPSAKRVIIVAFDDGNIDFWVL